MRFPHYGISDASQLAEAQDGKLLMRAGYSFPFAPWGVWSEEVTSLYANNDLSFYPGDGYVLTFDAEIKSRKEFLSYRLGAFYHYGSRYDVYDDDNRCRRHFTFR
jgi:hypothetical protein